MAAPLFGYDDHVPSTRAILAERTERHPLVIFDQLPGSVLSEFGGQYRDAIASAVDCYDDVHQDEDSITGAFSHAMRGVVNAGDGVRWETRAKKLRGRGRGASEKRYGADLAIEIEVHHVGGIWRKTLLSQAKKQWVAIDRRLAKQAQTLRYLPGGGIVIDYGPGGFRAYTAAAAVDAHGDARQIRAEAFRDLGDILGEDFLQCIVGSDRIFYDSTTDELIFLERQNEARFVPFEADEVVRTMVWPGSPSRLEPPQRKPKAPRRQK